LVLQWEANMGRPRREVLKIEKTYFLEIRYKGTNRLPIVCLNPEKRHLRQIGTDYRNILKVSRKFSGCPLPNFLVNNPG